MNFKAEPEAINLLTTSVIFTTVDDDNLLLNNAHKINDIRYEIRPGIAFALSRPQLRWNLAFGPALTLHQQVAQRDLFTETFGTDFKYDITAHLTARLRDNYVIRSDPFYDALNNGSLTQVNQLDQPNETTITAQAKHVSNLASGDLVYQLGPRTTVQASGSFYNVSFHNLTRLQSTPTELSNAQSSVGRANYNYRVSRRNSIGLIYNFQDLMTFRAEPTRTVSNSFLYSHTIDITPATTLELFAGPEHYHTHDHLTISSGGLSLLIPINTKAWSGGGMYGWKGNHTSFRLNFRHEIANGGGLPTAAHNTRASLDLRRELARTWTASATVSYGENKLLTSNTSGSSTEMLSGGIGIRHRLLRDFFAGVHYSHGHQRGKGQLSNRTGDVNLISVSLEYQFKESLGR
jgi:hypothetical protein